MRRLMLINAIGLMAFATFAETKTWLGGEAWDSPGSWSPAVVPAAADTVVFPQSGTVVVPSSFAGVFCVSNGATVGAVVAADSAFTVKPLAGSTFSKSGAGTLTVRAYMGVNPGTVEAAEGTLVLAGNGTDAAGAFGNVVVKAGAAVCVEQSPAGTRHAVAYRFAKSSGVYYKDEVTDTYGQTRKFTADSFHEMWSARKWLDASSVHEGILVSEGNQNVLSDVLDADGYKEIVSAKVPLYTYAQALVLREGTAASTLRVARTGFTGNFILGFRMGDNRGSDWSSGTPVATCDLSASSACGWQEFCLAGFSKDEQLTAAPNLLVTQDAVYPGGERVLSERRLWHGVACDTLTVEEDGSLFLAADQALAVGRAEQCTVAGTVTAGSTGSVFALMGGRASGTKVAFPLAALAGFNGTVELGATARAVADASCGDATYTIVGSGTVEYAAGVEARLADDFAGTVWVPNGVRAAVPARLNAVSWDGAGEIAYEGQTPVKGGTSPVTTVYAGASGGLFGPVNTVQGDVMPVPGFAETDAWSLIGGLGRTSLGTLADGPLKQESKPAEIVDGRLVLTDTVGRQQRGAVLKDFTIKASDVWEMSFMWRAWIPDEGKFAGRYGFQWDVPSYYFCCALRAADNTSSPLPGYDNVYVPANSAYGFGFGGYGGSGAMGVSRVWNGAGLGSPEVNETRLPGSSLHDKSVAFKVHLRCNGDGLMAVTLTRDTDDPESACGYGFTCDISGAFATGAAVLCFTGSTDGHHEATEAMWARQEVWDLEGTVTRPTYDVTPDGLAFAAENWNVVGKGWNADGSATLANAPGDTKSREYAVSQTGIPVYVPFVYSCDLTSSHDRNELVCSYSVAMYVQMAGVGVAFPATLADDAATSLPVADPAFGIYFSGWLGQPCWTTPNGGIGVVGPAENIDHVAGEPWRVKAGQPNRLTLAYDGWDTFTLNVTYADGRVFTSRQRYANLADGSYADKFFYPTFVTTEFWGNNHTLTLSNVNVKTHENPVARQPAGGLDFTSDNWKTPDAASSWLEEGGLRISNHQGGLTRERALAKNGITAYTPFVWSVKCRSSLGIGWNEQKRDQRLGMFVQTTGPEIEFPAANAHVLSELPSTARAFGMAVATYGGYCYWACPEGAAQTLSAAITGTGWMQVANTPNLLRLIYDGEETFTFEAAFPDGHGYSVSHRYTALADGAFAGKTFYPTFTSGSSFNSPVSGTLELYDHSIQTIIPQASSTVKYSEPLKVAASAVTTFTLAQRGSGDVATVQPGVRFAEVALAEGSTLAVAPQFSVAKASFDNLIVTGDATLAPSDQSGVVLGDLTFQSVTPCTLTVTGNVSFGAPQTITVPRIWRGHGTLTLVDCTKAEVLTVPDVDRMTLVDERGTPYGKRASLQFAAGCLRMVPSGMAVIWR